MLESVEMEASKVSRELDKVKLILKRVQAIFCIHLIKNLPQRREISLLTLLKTILQICSKVMVLQTKLKMLEEVGLIPLQEMEKVKNC